jgi:hypothetical protein
MPKTNKNIKSDKRTEEEIGTTPEKIKTPEEIKREEERSRETIFKKTSNIRIGEKELFFKHPVTRIMVQQVLKLLKK